MVLLKQLMIFGKTGLQGLPTQVTLSLWAYSRQGATGVLLFTTWDPVAGSERAPIPGNISGRSPRLNTQSVGIRGDSVGTILFTQSTMAAWAAMDSFWRTLKEFCMVRNSAR
jgi:hypothetical protein